MRYLADTTFLIDLVNGDPEAVDLALELEAYGDEVALSTISVMEYLRGIYYLYHNNEKKLREKLAQAFEDVNAFHIIPFTTEIASTTQTNNPTITTRNQKNYQKTNQTTKTHQQNKNTKTKNKTL